MQKHGKNSVFTPLLLTHADKEFPPDDVERQTHIVAEARNTNLRKIEWKKL